jgi:hypothetical protein
MGGAREERIKRHGIGCAPQSSKADRMEKAAIAAQNSQSGTRMAKGRPEAAGISAAINKTARQRTAIHRRALRRVRIHLQGYPT